MSDHPRAPTPQEDVPSDSLAKMAIKKQQNKTNGP